MASWLLLVGLQLLVACSVLFDVRRALPLVRCALFVVCCLVSLFVFVVCRLWCVVMCCMWLRVVFRCLLFVVRCWHCVVCCCLLYVVCYVVRGARSVLFVVCCLLVDVASVFDDR